MIANNNNNNNNCTFLAFDAYTVSFDLLFSLTLRVKNDQGYLSTFCYPVFVISMLLAYTNTSGIRCRCTPRDDGRFGFCKSEGKLNTDT